MWKGFFIMRRSILALALLIGSAVLTEPLLLSSITVVFSPAGEWNDVTRVVSPLIFIMCLVFYPCVIGTWFGNSQSTNVMNILIAIFTGISIFESATIIDSFMCMANDIHKFPRSEWWRASIGLRWSAWFAINIWYFYGRRVLP
jgi:hypothetical protein